MTPNRLTWLLSFEAAVGEGAEKAKNFSNITPGGKSKSTVPPAYKANRLVIFKYKQDDLICLLIMDSVWTTRELV